MELRTWSKLSNVGYVFSYACSWVCNYTHNGHKGIRQLGWLQKFDIVYPLW